MNNFKVVVMRLNDALNSHSRSEKNRERVSAGAREECKKNRDHYFRNNPDSFLCARLDSNQHTCWHHPLKMACLPISSRAR